MLVEKNVIVSGLTPPYPITKKWGVYALPRRRRRRRPARGLGRLSLLVLLTRFLIMCTGVQERRLSERVRANRASVVVETSAGETPQENRFAAVDCR